MKTKDLIQTIAIHRELAHAADCQELREHHWRKFSDLAVRLAHQQADTYDRKRARLERKANQVREKLALSALDTRPQALPV